jgi:sulfatase maturation enzyme AslB (radical SAM superfamily)
VNALKTKPNVRRLFVPEVVATPKYHTEDEAWQLAQDGARRGYIQPETLRELWLHTGTACNLRCPFCLEGSKPGDHRLEQIDFSDAKPIIDEALSLGIEQFSFTGGEPFINKDFTKILGYALEHRPCLVLTNGTKPVVKRIPELLALRDLPHAVRLRISFDFPDPLKHDVNRGAGNFQVSLDTLGALHRHGFHVSIARHAAKGEDTAAVDDAYRAHFQSTGVPLDTTIVAFPDFYGPGAHPGGVPEITENCMTTYHTAESRAQFMCTFSKMVVKVDGRMRVYACTLVDDDPQYDLGENLTEAMRYRVMLRHHRCFSCFQYGESCSEG